MLRALFSLLGFAAAAIVVSASGSAPNIRTLLEVNGRIGFVAQDGGRIAWETRDETNKRCPALVSVMTLATHAQKVADVRSVSGAGTCADAALGWGFGGLALAGDRVVWYQTTFGNNTYVQVRHALLARPAEREAGEEIVVSNEELVDMPVLVGDGDTAVLSYAAVAESDLIDCYDEDPRTKCDYVVLEGGAFRVVGNRLVRIPRAPAATLAALSGRTLALASQGAVGARTEQRPSGRDVEVRNVASGALLGRFTAGARIRGLALGGGSVYVLAGSAIEVHALGGALRRVIHVSGAADISASDKGIVYRVGRHIRIANPATGVTRLLADATSTPIGVSIEGGRVAWAENRKQGGALKARIRAVDLAA